MFGLYALPSDDLAGSATTVATIGSPSDEDSEYPAENLIAPTNTGHLNLPSRPAKLLDTSGGWELTFASPITVGGLHLVYHNLDEGLDVTLEPDGGTPITITIPAQWENEWWISPWKTFTPQSSAIWRLLINGTNSLPVQVGRLLLYNEWRQMPTDVRYGVEEAEDQGMIEHVTEGDVETMYELFGPRRSVSGEISLTDDEKPDLLTLFRSARNRILPWSLVPDATVNDAWFVRFAEARWSRVHETIGAHVFPFRVRELSRGLPWP